MQFEFATAQQIVFGPGKIALGGALAQKLGDAALVLTGASTRRAGALLDSLHEHQVRTEVFAVPGEPTVPLVLDALRAARAAGCALVLGVGGGSVMDTAKAVAALLANEGPPLDYLEVVGLGNPLHNRPAPCIAIPTTAGSGAEVTRNAVLSSPEHRVKVSMRHPWMLPTVALVDPELTHSMPPDLTAHTGLDAFTQLLEAFVSNQANPMTDGFCREGLLRASGALRRAHADGTDAQARENMSLASLLGGLALANAKLGAVHGFAGVIGGMFDAPHGAICARLLPLVAETNVQALRRREPHNPALERFAEAARIITRRNDAQAEDAIHWIRALCHELNVPPLANWGVREQDWPIIAEKSMKASSMQGNPVVLEESELHGILARA